MGRVPDGTVQARRSAVGDEAVLAGRCRRRTALKASGYAPVIDREDEN